MECVLHPHEAFVLRRRLVARGRRRISGGRRLRKWGERQVLELAREHVLLHEVAELVEQGLLRLDQAYHGLESVPCNRGQRLHLGGKARLCADDLRDDRVRRLALVIRRVRKMLLKRGDPGGDLGGPRQEARAHGDERALNLIVNGPRLLPHLPYCLTIVRDPTNAGSAVSKYDWGTLARLGTEGA